LRSCSQYVSPTPKTWSCYSTYRYTLVDIEVALQNTLSYSKSKSSTPNLLYLISTLRYITGTSIFMLPPRCDRSSTSLIRRPASHSSEPSRACSLRNFGPSISANGLSTDLVFSTWFLRVFFGLGACAPNSARVNALKIAWSIFGCGVPTSKTKWLGHAESKVSR